MTFHLCKSHGFELRSIFQFLLIVVPACANKVGGFLNLVFELIQPVDFFLFLILTAFAAEVTLSVTNCTCISLPLVTILAIDASGLIGLCFRESILCLLQFNRTLLSIILLIQRVDTFVDDIHPCVALNFQVIRLLIIGAVHEVKQGRKEIFEIRNNRVKTLGFFPHTFHVVSDIPSAIGNLLKDFSIALANISSLVL